MLRAWRRVASTRRLTKCRVDSGGEIADADAAVDSIVELLDDHQLDVLVAAVETGGTDGHISECILVDDSACIAPHITCCRLWRWPLLQHSGQVRCVPWCQNKHGLPNSQVICCHPYHWSCRLLQGNSTPYTSLCLQCFDTVGWASGSTSGL